MNQKINFPELVELLARKNNCSKREAENFLRELMALMVDTISSGEQLRINGLGVFKPIWVEDRASVNVRTGEPYLIPGHYKLTFTPAKAVREAVNEPFSCFCVEVLPDDAPLVQAPIIADEIDDVAESDSDTDTKDVDIRPDDMQLPTSVDVHSQQPADDSAVPDVDARQALPNELSSETEDKTTVQSVECVDLPELSAAAEEIVDQETIDAETSDVAEDDGGADDTYTDFSDDSTAQPDLTNQPSEQSESVVSPCSDVVSEEVPSEVELSIPSSGQTADEMDVSTPVPAPHEPVAPVQEDPPVESTEKPAPKISEPVASPTATKYNSNAETRQFNTHPYYLQDEIKQRFSLKKFLRGLVITIAVLLLLAGGMYCYVQYYDNDFIAELIPGKPRKKIETEQSLAIAHDVEAALPDTIAQQSDTAAQVTPVATQEMSEPAGPDEPGQVTDVVRKGTFLTTMSLKHYGHKAFWVYIYEENKAKIPNPNNVAAGTVLVIPPAHKYGINANDTIAINKALDIADEIKAKYD